MSANKLRSPDKDLYLLELKISALQFKNGNFGYESKSKFKELLNLTPGDKVRLNGELCKLVKEARDTLLKKAKESDTESEDVASFQLHLLKEKYHKGDPKLSIKDIIDLHLPSDCDKLTSIIKEKSGENKTFYQVLFNSKKMEVLTKVRVIKDKKKKKEEITEKDRKDLEDSEEYASLLNCKLLYRKVVRALQNPPKLPRRSVKRRSSLSRNTTPFPSPSERDRMRRELTGNNSGTSVRSSKLKSSKVRSTTLGRRRKSK